MALASYAVAGAGPGGEKTAVKAREMGLLVLVIEGDKRVLEYLQSLLTGESYRVVAHTEANDAIAKIDQGLRPDIVLIDSSVTCPDGLQLLPTIREMLPSVPAVILSCTYDPRYIVKAMKMGAVDVVLKPIEKDELTNVLRRCAMAIEDLRSASHEYEVPLSDSASFVFASEPMKEIKSRSTTVARFDLPVLILGESGTGKEILAQFIHKMSPRANRTFLKVNCAAMPADLLESELFGYEQGAFTGAVKSKPGKFELCNNGTILLDEIGEMPPSLQAKLLQVLQDGSFCRLGGRATIKVDVRVIAATNIDIKAAIAERKFREDLFYRLNGFSIVLPPLRKRKEEIGILMSHFIRKLAPKYARQAPVVSQELLQACMNHAWPGNLRELENFVKRFLVLGDERQMIAELKANGEPVPATTSVPAATSSPENGGGLKKLVRSLKGEAEMEAISAALTRTNWSRKRAAVELNISYKALLYKIRQYGIVPPPKNQQSS
jgi:DNA-binding NtrC family response regulator